MPAPSANLWAVCGPVWAHFPFFAMGGGPAATVCAVVALVLLLTWHFGETPAKQRVYNSSEIARLARRSRSHSLLRDHQPQGPPFVRGRYVEQIGELGWRSCATWDWSRSIPDRRRLRRAPRRRPFRRYLNGEKYYAVDLNPHLLTIGLEKEVAPLGLGNGSACIYATPDFGVDHFGVVFDYAISVSVWTHLPSMR